MHPAFRLCARGVHFVFATEFLKKERVAKGISVNNRVVDSNITSANASLEPEPQR